MCWIVCVICFFFFFKQKTAYEMVGSDWSSDVWSSDLFQALDSISPFAFAFGPRNWSPIVSDFRITPGGPYDLQQILQYDPQNQRLVTIGTLIKAKPYREFFSTIAFFRLDDNPSPGDLASLPPAQTPFQQPLSNQIRALVGSGS